MPEKTVLELFPVKQKDGEVGIEIEMEGKTFPEKVPTRWAATTDGSLRGESKEYVLRKPVKREKVKESLERLWAAFEEGKTELLPSDRCGVHIHINCQPLTFKQVMNYGCLYLVVEDLMVKWCGEDREGNLFSLRAKDAEYLIQALVEARQNGSFADLQGNFFRYASINFAALGKYGSLEFRAMRTPKEWQRIQTWTNLLLSIKDKSLLFEEPRNIIETLSGQGSDTFIRSIFEDLSDELVCTDMDRLVMQGMRRVQDIAYCDQVQKIKEGRQRLLEARLIRDQGEKQRLIDAGQDPKKWDNGWPKCQGNEDIPEMYAKRGQCIIYGGALYSFDRRWNYVRAAKLYDFNAPAPVPVPEAAPDPAWRAFNFREIDEIVRRAAPPPAPPRPQWWEEVADVAMFDEEP